MRIYTVGTVLSVTEPETVQMRNGKSFPRAVAIVRTKDEYDESFLAVEVCGNEKMQRVTEAQVSGAPYEMIVTIDSRQWTKNDGSVSYITLLHLKYIFGGSK